MNHEQINEQIICLMTRAMKKNKRGGGEEGDWACGGRRMSSGSRKASLKRELFSEMHLTREKKETRASRMVPLHTSG